MLVSECFKHHLKSLYLTEYPCHPKPTRVKTADDENEHPMYEIERLLDLIRDKKSPWHEIVDWTRNASLIRETYIRDSNQIDLNFVEKYFTSLRFNELQIVSIDKNMSNFVNLNELILTCNQIEDCDSSNLPSSLNILDLSGNYLNDLKNLKKKTMINLQHLGLAYNWISDVSGCFDYVNWPSLTSLDLSCNQFTDLISLTDSLLGLKKLKVLMLYGNPIVLLPGYRGYIINRFDDNEIQLFALDDKIINREERINSHDFKQYADKINNESIVKVDFKHVKNFPIREASEIDEAAPEVSITKYLLKILLIDDNYKDSKHDYIKHKLHSMNYKNQIWKKQQTYKLKYEETEEADPTDVSSLNSQLTFKIKSLRELRDFILDGTEIELVERKKYYKSKEIKPSESAMSFTKNKDSKGGGKGGDAKDAKKNKADPKNTKGKKKTQAEALESFSLFRTDDKCLARFELELNPLLDGHCKEIKKDFTCKIKLDTLSDLQKGLADKSLASIKEQDKFKKEKTAGKKSATKQVETHEQDADKPPVEIDVNFQLIDFQDIKELRNYYR